MILAMHPKLAKIKRIGEQVIMKMILVDTMQITSEQALRS
jgi:hypothetical protein